MKPKKVRVLLSCSMELNSLIEERAKKLDMSVPVYLKYAAIKDMEKEWDKFWEDREEFK